MKKLLLILLALTMCLSLCACSESREEKIANELESKTWTCTPSLTNQNSGIVTNISHTYRFEDGMAYVEVVTETNDWILGILPSYRAYYGPYTVDEDKTITITIAGEKEDRYEDYTLLDKIESSHIYYSFYDGELKLYLHEDMTEEIK